MKTALHKALHTGVHNTPCAAQQVALQLATDAGRYRTLAQALKINPPHNVVTLAHGSADHAAAYLAHLIVSRSGQLVSALPLALLPLGKAPVASHGVLAIAMAPTGRGQDLTEPLQTFRRGGSTTVALLNDPGSALAQAVEWALPLYAGLDTGQAGIGLICCMAAAARLCAYWPWGTQWDLKAALPHLPETLEQASMQDWSAAVEPLCTAQKLLVISQGAGLAIAQEAALRFREQCGLQASAWRADEIRHRHLTIREPDAVMLILALRGPAQAGLIELAAEMRAWGAPVILAAPHNVPSRNLTLSPAPHRDLDPITAIQSCYRLVDGVSRARGQRLDGQENPNAALLAGDVAELGN